MLQGVHVVVVAVDEAAGERAAEPLRAGLCTVSTAIVNVNALAVVGASPWDAIVVEVGDEWERFLPFTVALREDPVLRSRLVVGRVGRSVDRAKRERLCIERSVVDLADIPRAIATALRERGAAPTEHRELAERLRRSVELEMRLRTDGAALAHDVRALCGVVLGFASNLRDEIAGPLSELQARHVNQIVETTGEMATMLDRFGAALGADLPPRSASANPSSARPSQMRRTAHRSSVDLAGIVQATVAAFELMAEGKRVVLDVDAPEPVRLWGDAMQLKQVVVNLLANAIKFTPAGGHVGLSVRQAAPEGPREGVRARAYAELAVTDTGPGIPPEERTRVFDRGVRLGRDRDLPGAGLGLAVAREIVLGHGGDIRADDAPGGGARLVVDVPLDLRVRRQPPSGAPRL
jgi:signal transduction histidine kinase